MNIFDHLFILVISSVLCSIHLHIFANSVLNRMTLKPFPLYCTICSLFVLVIINVSCSSSNNRELSLEYLNLRYRNQAEKLSLTYTFQDFFMYHQAHRKALQDVYIFPSMQYAAVLNARHTFMRRLNKNITPMAFPPDIVFPSCIQVWNICLTAQHFHLILRSAINTLSFERELIYLLYLDSTKL